MCDFRHPCWNNTNDFVHPSYKKFSALDAQRERTHVADTLNVIKVKVRNVLLLRSWCDATGCQFPVGIEPTFQEGATVEAGFHFVLDLLGCFCFLHLAEKLVVLFDFLDEVRGYWHLLSFFMFFCVRHLFCFWCLVLLLLLRLLTSPLICNVCMFKLLFVGPFCCCFWCGRLCCLFSFRVFWFFGRFLARATACGSLDIFALCCWCCLVGWVCFLCCWGFPFLCFGIRRVS